MKIFKLDIKTKVAYYQHSWFTTLCCILSFIMFLATSIVLIKSNNNVDYIILKSITSFLFVAISSYSLYKLNVNRKWKHFIFWSFIVLCFISDILINFNFIAGMATFFVSHCLFIWFCTYIKKLNNLKYLFLLIAYIPVILLINLLFGLNIFKQNTIIWIFTNFYAIALFTSFLYTILIFYKNQNSSTLFLMLSLLLFVISDLLLMFNEFLNDKYQIKAVTDSLDFFLLFTYYLSMNINALNMKNIRFL